MATIRINDLDMYYEERGDGPTVLALHAATVSHREMGWIVAELGRRGYATIAPDLRGHGKTANPAPDMGIERMAVDLLELIYQLGRGPVHAIGFSMGGGVALYAARKKPDVFQSLFLLGTNYRASRGKRLIRAVGLGDPAGWPAKVATVFDVETGVLAGWDRDVEDFAAVTTRTTIVAADHDEFNDPADSVSLFQAMPNASLLIVPGADHVSLVRDPYVMQALRNHFPQLDG